MRTPKACLTAPARGIDHADDHVACRLEFGYLLDGEFARASEDHVVGMMGELFTTVKREPNAL